MKISNKYIVGFVDACLYPNFVFEEKTHEYKKNTMHYKFVLILPLQSVSVLYALKQKFQCGTVVQNEKNMYTFSVCKKNNLQKYIIPFFVQYPLQSIQKKYFYEFLKNFYSTNDNAVYAQSIRTKISFIVQNTNIYNFVVSIHNDWFAGFVDCIANFSIEIPHYTNVYKNYNVYTKMEMCVIEKNKHVLYAVQNFLQCGSISFSSNNTVFFTVTNVHNLIEKIFPKLYTKSSKNLLKTIKRVKFQKFRKIAIMVFEKKHYIQKNFVKIQKLKKYIDTH